MGVVNKSEEAGVRTAEPSRSHGQDVGGVPTSLSLEIFFLFLFLFLLSSCRKSSFGRLYKQANDAILPLRYSNDTVLVYGVRCHGERNDDTFKGVPEGSCCDKRSRLGS